jgi:hypothetical protein
VAEASLSSPVRTSTAPIPPPGIPRLPPPIRRGGVQDQFAVWASQQQQLPRLSGVPGNPNQSFYAQAPGMQAIFRAQAAATADDELDEYGLPLRYVECFLLSAHSVIRYCYPDSRKYDLSYTLKGIQGYLSMLIGPVQTGALITYRTLTSNPNC